MANSSVGDLEGVPKSIYRWATLPTGSVPEPEFSDSAMVAEEGEDLGESFVNAAKVALEAPVRGSVGLSGLVFGKAGGDSLKKVLRDRGFLAVFGGGGQCRVVHHYCSPCMTIDRNSSGGLRESENSDYRNLEESSL